MTSSASSSQIPLSRRTSYNRSHRVSSGSSSASASTSRSRSSRGKSTSPLNPAKQEVAVQMAAKRASTSSISSTVSSSYSTSSAEFRADTTAATSNMSTSASISKIPADVRAMLFEEEYQDEVIDHMLHMESQTIAAVELMDVQPELKWFMRPYLVDFLIEIHQTFRLRPETLFLTMNIVDRYVSKRIVYKRHYQLVGCAALLIAAKFEDAKDRVPTVKELSQMCCNAYDESAFAQMEGHVLSTIGWTLGHPTAEAWLRIDSVRGGEDLKTVNLARFFLEVSLFHRDFISLKSSALTKGALILARFICGLPQSTKLSPTDDAAKAAHMLDAYVSEHLQDLSLILIKKYSYTYFSSASTIVCDWYRARIAAAKSASPTGLLPAQAVTRDADTGAEDVDDDDESMCSHPTTPGSSVQSTPSRSMHEDEDEDDEDDMPVTPLSLYSLHDPLAAAATAAGMPVPVPSSRASMQEKENRTRPSSSSSSQLPKNASTHLTVQQPTVLGARKPLGDVVWNVNVQQF
ncbi:related to to G1/S-specific cyclin [Melanopsichium pennsylvanicum]|uniref:Related to to G1/S-specific cyclin n=2 Tax=Melanopsichium pennsylvanicum TaxID=63383 RepID=A0AAJ4XSJ1_9BASI|nr:related to to G1/S-specific cyclin [Melanopsichium pennsylvanicum 4]SNX87622.1 related to to G1/S-specific cyclin [Melanopsichium pennsylvanicum]